MSDEYPACDVCGKPATQLARDVFRHEPVGSPFVEFKASAIVKCGCDEHPVESEMHRTRMPKDSQ